MSKTIKIAEGVNIITDEGVEFVTGMAGVWDAFGWDIKNDEEADKCATAITRELLCFGSCDLSNFTTDGSTLILKIVPVKE